MADSEMKQISIEEFSKLDFSQVTLLDVRDENEVLIKGIPGALNISFSDISTGKRSLNEVPKDKTVYVYCRTGDFSEEVVDLLQDRGYDAVNVTGGINPYFEQKASQIVHIDAKGLKCPGPIVKVADTLKTLEDEQKVFVEATEDAFASDITVWCQRTGNKLDKLEVKPGVIEATITKGTAPIANDSQGKTAEEVADIPHGKNFVVFSGDLDKTIAVFIMANGAAALGRDVTIFFTFWGLNILRKPKKVRVKKNFIEKMFGIMMPRGTKKLGLSRMNMGGAGAKMIRWIMKEHNITSLEELIQQAIDHGVRLVAC